MCILDTSYLIILIIIIQDTLYYSYLPLFHVNITGSAMLPAESMPWMYRL